MIDISYIYHSYTGMEDLTARKDEYTAERCRVALFNQHANN